MNLVIRSADLETDRDLVIDTLFRYLTPLSDGLRFDWLYRNNPHGAAWVWIAIDTENGTIVGMASAFPRRVYVGEQEELCWILGDFCINTQYRSLGPALQLQRACLAPVDSGVVAFCYDFPSVSMMAIYKRLCITSTSQIVRLAKLLRVDRKIGKITKSPLLARGLSAVGNLALGFDYRPMVSGALTISLHDGECGEEFSTLARGIGGRYGACVLRSAEYLNWRYRANPLGCYELWTARREGILLAYVVVTQSGQDGVLVDLFGIENTIVISNLVAKVVALLRERGAVTVSAAMLESHPWVPLLQRLGFRPREASPVVVYAPPHPQSRCSPLEGLHWFFMHGDRDS